jgi:urocanate hydratase
MGILRHADAGYDRAISNTRKFGIEIPLLPKS